MPAAKGTVKVVEDAEVQVNPDASPGDLDFDWSTIYGADAELFEFEAEGRLLKMPRCKMNKGFMLTLNDLPEDEQIRRLTTRAFRRNAVVDVDVARAAFHRVIEEWDDEVVSMLEGWIEWCTGASAGK